MRLFEPCYYLFVITTITLKLIVRGNGFRVFLTVLAVVGAMTATLIR